MKWQDKPYHSLNYYLKNKYGEKVYKISLNAGCTCPNRDGNLDHRGCIFCSAGGSGDFAAPKRLTIKEQIEEGKALVAKKFKGNKFIAYFQAYTNTYGPLDQLESMFQEAIDTPGIVGLSIATRPDCLDDGVMKILTRLNEQTDLWVELGLQTIHEDSAKYIRRHYPLSTYDEGVAKLKSANINTIVHLILGLPHESTDDMLASVDYVVTSGVQGIKLQLLHVLRGTELEQEYEKGHLVTMKREDYINLVVDAVERLPQDMVVHRLTGDAPRTLLVSPRWSTDKKNIFNQIHQEFNRRKSYQSLRYQGLTTALPVDNSQ